MRTGDVVCIRDRRLEKDKYLLCIDPSEGLFFYINTRRPFSSDAGVLITTDDVPDLEHDSYIDTGMLARFSIENVLDQLARRPSRKKGAVPDSVLFEVRRTASSTGLLAHWQLVIVQEHIPALD